MPSSNPYVERREAGFYLSGSRVPLDHVVREYWNGEPPECIHQHFPSLSLDQVNGAIAFYIGHRAEVDADIRMREANETALLAANQAPPDLIGRLNRSRQSLLKK